MQTSNGGSLPSAGSSWRRRDHTRGNLLGSLAVLALPSIGTSLAGAAAFQLIDLKFVSELGAAPLAAVVLTNQSLRQLAFLLVLGTSVGAQAIIARHIGAGDSVAAAESTGQVLALGGLLCLGFACIGGLFARPLLALVAHDPAVLEVGVVYVRLTFLLMFGFVFIPLVSAILNGSGDATTPMVLTLLATPVSLFAEWCLIFGRFGAPELGLPGVALGAAAGSLVGVTLGLWVLLTGRTRIELHWRQLWPRAERLRELILISWQPALQLLGRTLVIVYFVQLAGLFGARVQAAYGIGIRLEMVVMVIVYPIASACATLVGQNLGAKRSDRAVRAVWAGIVVNVSICAPCAVLFWFWGETLMSAFSQDPEVVRTGAQYLRFVAVSLIPIGPYLVALRTLQAAGDMTAPMLISNLSALGIAIPLGHVLATRTELGPLGLWIAVLTYAGTTSIATILWLLRGRWLRHGAERSATQA